MFLNGAPGNALVDKYIVFLPNAEGPVRSLIFHSRVPPAIKVNDMGGMGQIETSAACLQRQNEEGRSVLALELPDQFAALFDSHVAVQDKAGSSKDAGKIVGKGVDDFPKLREHKDLFLT